MIELLILYILNTRDKTVYGLRRDIVEKFGTITKPSLGTIHPALKRLSDKKAVVCDKKYSEGGKKSTYYSITNEGKKVFKELFFEEISENPTLFHNQLSVRLLTVSMLGEEDRQLFFEELTQKTEAYKIEIQNSLNNTYIEYDNWQKIVITSALENTNKLSELIEKMKAN